MSISGQFETRGTNNHKTKVLQMFSCHVKMVLQLFNAIRFEPCQFYRKDILLINLIQMFDWLCSAGKIRSLATRTTVIKYLKCWSGSRDIWNEIHSYQWNYPGWLWPSHNFSIPLASLNCCGEIIEESNTLLKPRENVVLFPVLRCDYSLTIFP